MKSTTRARASNDRHKYGKIFHLSIPNKFNTLCQWLNILLCFNFLRFNVFFPFLVRTLDRNPCRLFRTLWLGSYVSLGPFRTCIFAREGWVEMRGRRLREDERVVSDCGDEVANASLACRRSREGRVWEMMLRALQVGLEWARWGHGLENLPSG